MKNENKTKKQLINELVELSQRIIQLERSETERKQAEEQLKEAEQKFKIIFDNVTDGILLADLETKKFYLGNKTIFQMLGYSPEEIKNISVMDTHPQKDLPYIIEQFERQSRREFTLAKDISVKRKDGTVFYADINSSPIAIAGKTYLAGIFRDVTERKMLDEKLKRYSFYDTLTDLPNRALFLDRLKASIARADRQKGYMFAVLVLGLDRFKNINNSLGQMVGDQLLIEVAARLKKHIRPYDTVARLAGDEFAVLLANVRNIRDVISATERLQNTIKLPIKIYNQDVHVMASIGITVSKTGYEKPEDILRDAYTAMHKAKELGRACYVIFDEIMHAQATAYLQLENGLRQAVEKNQFLLNYQPIILSDTNEIVGFEVLIRWKCPGRDLVYPNEFIPAAEESGLIIPIGKWLLREACRQMHAWHELFPAHSHLTISVNISNRQFTPDFAETIKQILNETGLNPASLKLEITERVIMNNPEIAAKVFSELKDLNIKVQMDDFGTGYSSLGYLYIFPIDALKIDRSFIQSMCINETAMEIVKTIISMARHMKMDVIAEGVETVEQLEELRKLKCNYYQGYWFSKPLGMKEAEVVLDKLTVT